MRCCIFYKSSIPVEAKAQLSTQAKSYLQFCKKYRPSLGFKFSMRNVGDNRTEGTLTYSLPLCMLWKLDQYLEV